MLTAAMAGCGVSFASHLDQEASPFYEWHSSQQLAADVAPPCPAAAAPPPPLGPPLNPIIPINILDKDGFPVRNDNLTNFAYVGSGDGLTPPEIYSAFHPQDPTNTTPIAPGETTYLRNAQTGMYCRLTALPSTYPLSITSFSAGRGLLQSCATRGVLCDQPTAATATILTYTGGARLCCCSSRHWPKPGVHCWFGVHANRLLLVCWHQSATPPGL